MSDQNKGNQSENGGSGENPDPTKNQSPTEDKVAKEAYEGQKTRAEKAESEAKKAKDEAAQAKADLEALQSEISTKSNSSGYISEDEIKALAEEHDVDPSLIKSILAIQTKTMKQTEKLIDEKVGALKQDESKKALRTQFTSDLTSALSSEYD